MKLDANSTYGFSTRAIHAGQEPAPGNGAIMTPIYQTSTYVQAAVGVHGGYEYGRTGNPTRTALEANLAALEGGRFGICFSSACAAADAVLPLLAAGVHVVCGDDLYAGTSRLLEKVYGPFGLKVSAVALTAPARLEAAFTRDTRLVWLESPTNPLLKLADIERIAAAAHARGALVLVDNTFATPYLQNPLALGADLVLHSSTKYLGGHSDVIGGAIVTDDEGLAGRLHYIQNAVGAVPSPHDCYLLLRSTKTLALRMERHCENALAVAGYLSGRAGVARVIYPGLPGHPQHELAARQMRAGGGVVTVALDGGAERARRFLESVRVFALAESLGAVESLVESPALMTHASLPPEVRASRGISDSLVRLSVGVEDLADLIADLDQALDRSLVS